MDRKRYDDLLTRLRSTHRGKRVSELLDNAATAIFDLLIENCGLRNAANAFKARAEALEAKNAALRKMQPVQLDDTGAKAASLAAEVSDLRQKLAEAEGACAYHKSAMESYREGARARYKLMYSRIKKLSEALEQEMLRAESAEAQRDAAIKELDGVAAAVDDLSDFIDEQIHPLVQYDIYLALRENADAISMWQYEAEWRGQKEEKAWSG